MRPYRKLRVAVAIRNIVSEAILRDLNDPRIGSMTSITRVEMSPDLQIARVYIAVRGGEAIERRTLAGMKSATGHLRRLVARGLPLRTCPELRFMMDESFIGVRDMMALLEQNRRENPNLVETDDDDAAADAAPSPTGGDLDAPIDEEDNGLEEMGE